MNVPNWNLKKKLKIHIWPQISQKVISSVETWSRDQFSGFTYFCFFSKRNSGAVIPWDVDLHFCRWQGHFWSNIHESFQIRILNNSNLWKNFEEHLSTLRGSRWPFGQSPAGNYMFKVNNRNTRRCEICSKLTTKTPERRHWRLWCLY